MREASGGGEEVGWEEAKARTASLRTEANQAREEVRSEWVTMRKVTGTVEGGEGVVVGSTLEGGAEEGVEGMLNLEGLERTRATS